MDSILRRMDLTMVKIAYRYLPRHTSLPEYTAIIDIPVGKITLPAASNG
jgi:hypothetical protein